MNKPVRTTLIFGLLSALAMVPVLWYQRAYGAWPMALELALWLDLAVYATLLCRWSRTRFVSVVFPLALLLGVALWPRNHAGFVLMALGIFGWIRSGICYRGTPLRALTAELITVLGGGMLVALWWPHSALSWALAVWLFYLVQTLYFFILPAGAGMAGRAEKIDRFEQARREAERMLESL
jgi:hypothetical protein